MPNVMGHTDNYIPANPMATPASIVPEWYLLPYYTILRSIPNKLLGVIGMFGSLLILLALPLLDTSRLRGNQFRPLMKFFFWVFVVTFFILTWIGSQHPNTPFLEIGQIFTIYYFAHFLVITPLVGIIENTLHDVNTINNPLWNHNKFILNNKNNFRQKIINIFNYFYKTELY
jgi:ubiquinol-cytochrome c reductase cytochrome b subunit